MTSTTKPNMLYHRMKSCPNCFVKESAYVRANSTTIRECNSCPARRRIVATDDKVTIEYDYVCVLNAFPQQRKRNVDW